MKLIYFSNKVLILFANEIWLSIKAFEDSCETIWQAFGLEDLRESCSGEGM